MRRPAARRRRGGGRDRVRGRPGRSPRDPWAPSDSGARRGGPPIDRIRIPRRLAGEQLEQDRPEPEDVRRDRRVRVPPRSRGAGDAEPRDPGNQLATILLAEMAQLGVHEPGGMRRREHDPGGGEVPVAEALPVRLVDGAGQCLHDLGRRQDGKRPSFDVFGEALSLHELRGQEFGSVMATGESTATMFG